MPKKHELFAMYNDLINHGYDSLSAINALSITHGVTSEDLIEMDNEFLGGQMYNIIPKSYDDSLSKEIDNIINPKPYDYNDDNNFNPFDI